MPNRLIFFILQSRLLSHCMRTFITPRSFLLLGVFFTDATAVHPRALLELGLELVGALSSPHQGSLVDPLQRLLNKASHAAKVPHKLPIVVAEQVLL